jgi:hypothetical protein
MTFPAPALEARAELDRALHRSDRRIGVTTRGLGRGLSLRILTRAKDDDAARGHALRLVTAALGELGLAELAPHITVDAVIGRPVLPGGPHPVEGAPRLGYRSATLPDGRVVNAACAGPLGEWFAYVAHAPGQVMAGRSLPEVLSDLFELPWGKKERWFEDALEELAGQPTSDGIRYPCPCCDDLTLQEPPPGTFAICKVCRWEDDRVQFRDPDYRGGANRVSLREAREAFRQRGQ